MAFSFITISHGQFDGKLPDKIPRKTLLTKFLELFNSDDIFTASLRLFSELGIEFHETPLETVAEYLAYLLSQPRNIRLRDKRYGLGLLSTFWYEEPVFVLDRERTRHEDQLRIDVNYTTGPLRVQVSEKPIGEFEHGFGRFHAPALSNDGLSSSAAAC